MRTKHTFRLPPGLALKLADYALRKRVPQAFIVETALASFLSPDSGWLKRYDRPLNGPVARSIYTALDLMVVPARDSSYVEGDRAENHYLSPLWVRRWDRRPAERVHTGVADHVMLPRHNRLALLAA